MKKLIFQTVLAGLLLILCPELLAGAEPVPPVPSVVEGSIACPESTGRLTVRSREVEGEDIQEYFSIVGADDTNVGGLICEDTNWTAAGSPYIVTSGILIGCNATLTIEPDVVVRFDPQMAIVVGHSMWGKGKIVARGTAESPIIFTSVKDPNSMLDPAKPGDWSRIHFSDYAVDATFDGSDNYTGGCILEHCIVEYAGFGNYAAIFAEKSSPFLNYCEVRHNLYYGIQVDGTSAPAIKITNCQVWDHPTRGIYISGGSVGNRLLNNNIHDNRDGGIYFINSGSNTLTGNTISGNTSYYGGGIYFINSSSNTLTGNTISGNTASGDGGGIFFYSNAGSNTITGNTISGNISSSTGGGMCFNASGGNTLIENTITDNTSSGSGGGIFFYFSGSNTLTGNTISGNTASDAGGGIYFYYNSGSNTLTGNLLETNTSISGLGGAVYIGSSGDTTFVSGQSR
jgi:parallel beta-helix repeat protein